jgi:hypothetical protein
VVVVPVRAEVAGEANSAASWYCVLTKYGDREQVWSRMMGHPVSVDSAELIDDKRDALIANRHNSFAFGADWHLPRTSKHSQQDPSAHTAPEAVSV